MITKIATTIQNAQKPLTRKDKLVNLLTATGLGYASGNAYENIKKIIQKSKYKTPKSLPRSVLVSTLIGTGIGAMANRSNQDVKKHKPRIFRLAEGAEV